MGECSSPIFILLTFDRWFCMLCILIMIYSLDWESTPCLNLSQSVECPSSLLTLSWVSNPGYGSGVVLRQWSILVGCESLTRLKDILWYSVPVQFGSPSISLCWILLRFSTIMLASLIAKWVHDVVIINSFVLNSLASNFTNTQIKCI